MQEVFSYEALVHAIAGTAGGSTAMTLMYPLDQIRTYLQVKKSSSTIEGTKALIKEDGIAGLYRGLGPVIMSLAVSNFVYFYANNLLKLLTKRWTGERVTVAQNLLIASLAGVINVLLTCPLWVANTRLKLQFKAKKDSKNVPYKGMTDCLVRVAKEEGLITLWNGTSASLLLVSNPTINFVIYDKVRQIMVAAAKAKGQKGLTSWEIFVNGAIAKACATILTYPIQIAQTRLRAAHGGHGHGPAKPNTEAEVKYKNTLDVLIKLYKSDGLLGWFAGMDVKLVQTVLTAAFQFVCYEHIKDFIFYIFRPKKH